MSAIPNREESSHLYKTIIDNLQTMIRTGALQCGQKLPSERELAETFNVSRVPVREALKILEYMGILENRPGDGMYVRNTNINDLVKKMSFTVDATAGAVLELAELRCTLEGMAAYYAALRRTDEDLAFLRKNMEDMRLAKKNFLAGQGTLDEQRNLSIQFHFGIVRISRNSILANVYENLLPLLEITRQFTVTKNGILYNTILAHNAIYDRIAAQDAEGAQMCMTEHMQGTKDLLEERLKGLNSDQVARQFSVHSVQLEPNLPPFRDTSSTQLP